MHANFLKIILIDIDWLQLRFGESQLHFCEVMLKDVADSKRINTRITEDRKQKGEVEVGSLLVKLILRLWKVQFLSGVSNIKLSC